MRIQKFLRQQNIASLRGCDALVQSQKIIINGEVLKQPTYFLEKGDKVIVSKENQKKIELIYHFEENQRKIYFLFHKPKNILSSHKDSFGRETVIEKIKQKLTINVPLFFSGRLDFDARGLMIVSNDGNFIQYLSHPSKGVKKKYIVTANRNIDFQKINFFAKKGCSYKNISYSPFIFQKINSRKIIMILREGKKNEIKNIFLATGNQIIDIFRVSIGKYQLKELKEGEIISFNPSSF